MQYAPQRHIRPARLAAALLASALALACTEDPGGERAPASPRDPLVAPPVGPELPGASPAATDAGAGIQRKHVVVLSMDGLRPDAVTRTRMRNLMRFAGEGTRAARAYTIPLSLTLPSHSSMLSGYDLEHHGVDWNVPLPEKGYIKVPTIFQVARGAGLRTIMIMGKGKFFTLQIPDTFDEVHEVGGDEEGITDQAVFVARKRNFDLMFIHFPNPDITGHQHGWMSEPYLTRVGQVDVLFGRLLEALPPDTTMIVTADHGGHEFGHGQDLEVDRRIPWMIRGPKIRRNYVLNRRIETMDTAATLLRLLGLQLDPGAQGKVVEEVFR